MSWLSSLQDGLKNAESLLNAVDQKVKDVAEVTTSSGTAEAEEDRGRDRSAPYVKPTPTSTTTGRSAYGSGQNEPRETLARFSPSPSPLKSTHKSSTKTLPPSPSPIAEKSFEDLTSVLNGSDTKAKGKGLSTPARKDPRLASPRQSPRHASANAAAAARKKGPKNENAITSASTTGPGVGKPSTGSNNLLPDVPGGFGANNNKSNGEGNSAGSSGETENDSEVERKKKAEEERAGLELEKALPTPPTSVAEEPKRIEENPPSLPEANAGTDPGGSTLETREPSEQSVTSTAVELPEPPTVSGVQEKQSALSESTSTTKLSTTKSETSSAGEVERAKDRGEDDSLGKAKGSSGKSRIETVSDARAQMREKLQKEIEEAESVAKLHTSAGGTNKSASTSSSSGSASSKEARLSAMCERLSGRLQQYKIENEQLEEMLKQAEKEKESIEEAAAKMDQQKAVLEGKESKISQLQLQLEEANAMNEIRKKEILSLKGEHSELAQKMSNSEIRVLSAAREELNALELRFETERQNHKATKETALRREQDLEALVAENTTALASMQQRLDERSERVAHLEKTNAILEQDFNEMTKENTEKERQQKHMAASREERESQLRDLQQKIKDLELQVENSTKWEGDAKTRISELEAELQQMKTQSSESKNGETEKSSNQQKLNEMTDLLYLKQAQLEKLASDKAAIQMSLEKELNGLKQELKQTKSINSMQQRRAPAYDVEDVVPIESIGPMYDRLAKNRRVGNYIRKGAQALDFSTSTVVGLLRQQPVVRIGLFLYIISIHFFLYYMMSRMQTKAITMEGMIKNHPGDVLPTAG